MTNTNAPADGAPSPAALVPEGVPSQPPPSGAPNAFEQCSDRIDAISGALAKAQGMMANPAKSAVNPHFKAQYANLSAGLNAIRGALSANGIAIVQTTRMDREMLMLHTMLAHASGQWIGSQWPVVKLPATPQVIGSALTYARRYSLFALTGIAGEDDDDDGNAARESDPAISIDDVVYVESLLRDTGSDVAKFLEFVGASSVPAMRLSQFKKGASMLETKKRRAREVQ